jgi:hypothetical protein
MHTHRRAVERLPHTSRTMRTSIATCDSSPSSTRCDRRESDHTRHRVSDATAWTADTWQHVYGHGSVSTIASSSSASVNSRHAPTTVNSHAIRFDSLASRPPPRFVLAAVDATLAWHAPHHTPHHTLSQLTPLTDDAWTTRKCDQATDRTKHNYAPTTSRSNATR